METPNWAAFGLRFGFSIVTLVILFLARDNAVLADLYVEVSFWVSLVATIIMGIAIALAALIFATER